MQSESVEISSSESDEDTEMYYKKKNDYEAAAKKRREENHMFTKKLDQQLFNVNYMHAVYALVQCMCVDIG